MLKHLITKKDFSTKIPDSVKVLMSGDKLSHNAETYLKLIDSEEEAEWAIRFYLDTSLHTNPFIAGFNLDVDTLYKQSFHTMVAPILKD